MKVSEQIKFIRTLRGWTQENLAHKLGISTHAYAKIERGETDVNLSRLEQIAQVMEIELPRLLGLDDKTVLNFTGDNNTQCQKIDNNWKVNSPSTEQTECQHELEKAHLMIEQQKTEIEYLKQQVGDLKQQVSDLREVIYLLKKTDDDNKR
jgi:transcriptional regulator with XRE-family HTH domain